jgi:hypothetical protein
VSTGRKILIHTTADEVRKQLPPATRRRVDRLLEILRTDPHVALPNLSPMTRQYSGVNIVQGTDFKITYTVVSDTTGDYAKVPKIEAVDAYSNPGAHLWKSVAITLRRAEYELRYRSFSVSFSAAEGYQRVRTFGSHATAGVVESYRAVRLRLKEVLKRPPSS